MISSDSNTDSHPADLNGGLSLPARRYESLYHVRCEDCPESAVIAQFKRARYVGRCHAHFQSHQVIVEVFE